MDISQLMPNLSRNTNVDEENVEVEEGPKGRQTKGPERFRVITAGQQRRQMVRDELTKRRKASDRYRREWMKNRRATAVLRGQLQVVGLVPFRNAETVVISEAMVASVTKHLEKAYGSVGEALEHYRAIVAEAARQHKQAQA